MVPCLTPDPLERLPTLDLRRFETDRENFLADVRAAAREAGFFYLVGHGIEPKLVDEVLTLSRRFFALPERDKRAIEMIHSPHFRGYNRAGLEHTRGKPDWREQIDIGAEREALPFDPAAPAWRRLQGPNQWPDALPELKPALLRYQAEVTAAGDPRPARVRGGAETARRHIRADLLAGAQPAAQDHPLSWPRRRRGRSGRRRPQGFRVRHHPAAGQGRRPAGRGRTRLDRRAAGAGTFVVNIGEILELASNGYLRANVHRVVSPPEGRDRLSVAFFLGARLDATVPVLDLPPELAAQSRGLTQDPLNPLFHEVGRNYLKSRLRSHPDVARRHHADLLDPTQKQLAPASAY